MRYETIRKSAGNKKWIAAAVAADLGNSVALIAPPTFGTMKYGIAVGAVSLCNRGGAAADVALAGRYMTSVWAAGQVTAAGAYTADTADAQSAATADFPLHNRADSGSGFLVSADLPFNILGLVQSAAGDQVTPVQLVEYWDGAAWVDIAGDALINNALDANSTGEKIICFPTPPDWAVGGSGTDVPATKYNLRVRQTHGGAGTADPVASQLFIGHAAMLVDELADKDIASLNRAGVEYLFPPQCEALFPVFSIADRGNFAEVDVRLV